MKENKNKKTKDDKPVEEPDQEAFKTAIGSALQSTLLAEEGHPLDTTTRNFVIVYNANNQVSKNNDKENDADKECSFVFKT